MLEKEVSDEAPLFREKEVSDEARLHSVSLDFA